MAAGNSIRVQASVTSATAAKVRVVLEIHDPSGAGAKQWSFNNQKFTAGQSRQYSKTWRVPRTADTGIYVVTIGIFDAESGEQYLEDDNAGQFSVTARSTREGR